MKKADKIKQVLDLYRDGPRTYRLLLMGDNGLRGQFAECLDLDGDYVWQDGCIEPLKSDYIRKTLGLPRRYVGEKRP